MKHDIISKLRAELAEPIVSERQVVYVLVELRKLIELNNEGGAFKSLKFCCDWVAHAVLTGPMAREIVRLFDKYQELNEQMRDGGYGQTDTSFLMDLEGIIRLSKFRNEFGAYLKSQNLDSSIADDRREWVKFLTYYARVIEDCPLKCVSHGLRFTDEVVLKVVDVRLNAEEVGSEYRLLVEWNWVSKTTGIQCKNQRFY